MKMTPKVVIIGSLLILVAIVFTVVFVPYATRSENPSEIFRSRSPDEAAGRALYIANGCVYCHS
ncbi:MAG: cytochrome-c oxidase, partial [Pseudomonadota bacterium]